MEITINYLAVLVAAVANMIVGTIWYGPVLGKTWQKLMGFTPESMKNMPLTPAQAMIGGLVTALLMSYVLAHFVFLYGAVDLGGALELAFWVWVGFLATETAGVWLWEGKSSNLFMFNAAERLVAVFLMTIILTLWV